ncbi:hypothetical protein Misp01_55420 [Microtetraspora sp. NBRC 13810]|uniref:hypothetical protein n=1 Tax=Microtetraspora sp. NBRC 13810 TaxID=3030990 RepID=UPI0024A2EE4E|nr:hypothetical protein [Microtetraspora sp. NBRC 13810]GLW10414.1 hypothetical protein Misp01_55420 [Microtetraspora sp. NBRC 13810]
MTFATEVKKITETKPFYAVAGAGDFAFEKLKELPVQLEKLQAARGEFRDSAKDLPVRAREYASKAETYARDLPEKAKVYADTLSQRAGELYEDFASRGRKVVSRVSGEAATGLEEVSAAAKPAPPKPIPAKKPATRTRSTNNARP